MKVVHILVAYYPKKLIKYSFASCIIHKVKLK